MKTGAETSNDQAFDPIKLNKQIAYNGALGKARKKFGTEQLKQLQDINERIMQSQIKEAQDCNKTITCRKGCSACCSQYVPASLQECEAIVYYLYKHESKMNSFLDNYTKWKAEIYKNQDVLCNIYNAFNEMWKADFSEESQRNVAELGSAYTKLNIPCPFLKNNACLIYDARPLVCSSQVAVTPAEWCNPANPDSAKQELILMLPDNFSFLPFYQESFNSINLNGLCMPFVVYNIIEGGFLYLTQLNDKNDLLDEAVKDEEVKKILDEQLDYYEENDPNFVYEIDNSLDQEPEKTDQEKENQT
jgi:Fe-S-cluster containining protein